MCRVFCAWYDVDFIWNFFIMSSTPKAALYVTRESSPPPTSESPISRLFVLFLRKSVLQPKFLGFCCFILACFLFCYMMGFYFGALSRVFFFLKNLFWNSVDFSNTFCFAFCLAFFDPFSEDWKKVVCEIIAWYTLLFFPCVVKDKVFAESEGRPMWKEERAELAKLRIINLWFWPQGT